MADDGLRRWTNYQGFRKFFSAANGDNRKLWRKSLDVVFLLVDEAAGNQHRKRHVLMAGGLESAVQRLLEGFPQGPAGGTEGHAAAHRRAGGGLGFEDQMVVPLGENLCAGR